MPASLLELKKKIASVKQTGKITEAMRMVSASKLSQTEKRDKGYTVYNDHVRKTLSHLISSQIVEHLQNENATVDDRNISKIDYSNVFSLGVASDLIQELKTYQKVILHQSSHDQIGALPVISSKEIAITLDLIRKLEQITKRSSSSFPYFI